jgi:DNA helicase HerA-like ATPase
MAKNNDFRWPADDERTLIVGMTGSGKTQFGAYLLAQQNFKRKPWVIVDYKGDVLLNSLERTREIGYEIPKKPGLYILHAHPEDGDAMENWLRKTWERGNMGLYFDEGMMLPNQRGVGAAATLQIQGRSRKIPIITLSQRPVDISRYAVSQASHVVMFRTSDKRDDETLTQVVPRDFPDWVPQELGTRLPDYHSRWYDVGRDQRFVLQPVPDADTIREQIDGKLEPRSRFV